MDNMRRKLISMLTPRYRSVSGNAPLSFRAKAGYIKSLKQYGKCVQDGTPTPDAPVDIVCNNGVLRVSKNLFNAATETEDYYINDSGVVTSNANYACSDLILVFEGETYTASLSKKDGTPSGSLRIHGYDINGDWVQMLYGVAGSQYATITIPSGIKYVRLSWWKGEYADDRQFEMGATASTYRPYGSIYADGTPEVLTVRGRNLFDDSAIRILSGLEGLSLSNRWGETIDVSAGTYRAAYTQVANGNLYVRVFDRGEWGNYQQLTRIGITFTLTGDGVILVYCGSGSNSRENLLNHKIQVELGSITTAYEPYYNGGTATAADLLSVGDYKDIQDVIQGCVVRNIGVKVLDGTEDWKLGNGTRESSFYVYSDNALSGRKLGVTGSLVSHFEVQTSSIIGTTGKCFFDITTQRINFTISPALVNSVSAFKQYLADQYTAGTPVIIVYLLAEPTTESVTPQSLRTRSGNNTIDIDSNVDPVEIEVKYKG